jgi:DNA polymerase elongation subunit (family B)
MDVVLFGQNQTPGIVAVQQVSEQTIRWYRREDGKLSTTDVEFFPFFFLADDALLGGFPRRHWLKELAGSNFYRYLAAFTRWHDMWEAVRHIINTINKSSPSRISSYVETDQIHLRPDPLVQYFLQSGVTLFKGMPFGQLRRMQITIHALARRNRPSDARKSEDRIVAIGLTDSEGWRHTLDGRKLREPEMMTELMLLVRERDPDVIEGHGLSHYILPYLVRRCELYNLELTIGRDESPIKSFSPRGGTGERDLESSFFDVAGRHLVDTYHLAQIYDFSKRSFESLSLRHLASHFGFTVSDTLQLKREQISTLWHQDPAAVLDLAQHESTLTEQVSRHLSPSSFYMTQMCPLPYGTVCRSGSALKIESLLLREYIRQKHSIPKPQLGSQTTGGYTDIFMTGIASNVLHADIESLYPSVMLNRNIKPETDELGVFQILLRELTTRRLDAKRAMQESNQEQRRHALDAFQSSLKILINSFYGYLGYARGLFNDYARADEVTTSGQDLLRTIIKQLELHNSLVIEVDTDGLFFSPPDNVRGEEAEDLFVEKMGTALPEGIRLALAGRYKKMLSYKKKNYALLDYRDRVNIRGSALISRSLERFAKVFLQLCIHKLLQEDIEGLHTLYVSLRKDIMEHRWDVLDFARTETLHDSIDTYEREVESGKRKPSAAYEVAKRSGLPVRVGDRVTYYVTGNQANVKIIDHSKPAEEWDPNFPDENTAYYLERLEEAARKFELFFEAEDFKRIFSSDDLFGFRPEGIKIINRYKGSFTEQLPPDEEKGEFRIWLDEDKRA